ncbi:site-specific integrase [Phreatobacter oligotrophus]|uniref:Site-specific recombinase XerD n=1 Tax=Phreatobacter oligotrophus TaxID=1122261 RepID=A0A2T4YX83_9HYPH|nr:site-specific integrase [Phreatobacter oligotrophus]PTM50416.1 site-specific recombinase XerD [Phreatobacter oligotrophus]
MASAKLTKRSVDAITPRATEFCVWDAEVSGFGVRVRPSGAMSYLAMYRTGGRNSPLRKVTLGSVGKLTVEEARAAARTILAKAELGEDVAEQLSNARKAETISDLCDLYFKEAERGVLIGKRGKPKKASTLTSDRGRITRHIKPLLGRKTVQEVTKADVERFLRDVASGRTATDVRTKKHGRAIVRGGQGTATRTVRLLGGIFTYAIELGMRQDNPVHGVRKFADGQSERFLSSEELSRLGAALREAETIGLPWNANLDAPGAKHLPRNPEDRRTRLSPHATAAIRFLILTGLRLREALSLRWSDVDVERGLLFLPDTKTGRRTVVLGDSAMEILQSVPRISGFRFVFAGEKLDRPRSDLKRPWSIVTRAAGLEGVRLHDLRHTFASHGAAAGMGLTVVGRLLGHADIKTTNRYSHFDTGPLRRAADAAGAPIAAALNGTGQLKRSGA